ncbi:MAG TPA: hypothetical protein VFZ25_01305, partial [Chloroflexota bacterium]|nr:hypothetical protein [Chloroflexota bacterium]
MFKRLLLSLGIVVLILTGCDSLPAAAPSTTTGSTSDSVGEAYQLLLQNSADPVSPAALGKAAVKGIRTELATQGVIPPVVAEPTFTSDPNQNLQLIQAVARESQSAYRGKLPTGPTDAEMIDAMATSIGDCHTVYLPPAEYQQQVDFMNDATQFGGIGAELHKAQP